MFGVEAFCSRRPHGGFGSGFEQHELAFQIEMLQIFAKCDAYSLGIVTEVVDRGYTSIL